MNSLSDRLQRLQRAFAAQIFLARLTDLALAGALLWIVWTAVCFASHAPIWQPVLLAGLMTIELAAAAFWAWQTKPDLPATAARIDRLAGTRDRFTTALALRQPVGAVEEKAAAECARFLSRFDDRPWTRRRLSPRFAALLAPLILTLLLSWIARPAPPTAEEIALRENAEARAAALVTLAQKVEAPATPEAKKLAAEMKQAAARIQSAPTAAEADKTSLRALSELAAALKNQALATRQAELDALAKALASQPATSAAGKSLQERNFADAAQKLAEAARQLDAKAAQKLADAMKQALAQLGRGSESPLAKPMSALAGGPQSASAALQKLAQMLQQQAGDRPPPAAGENGRAPTEQELQNLLENLRDNPQGAQREIASFGAPKPGAGAGQIQQNDFSKAGAKSTANGTIPSGQPGSEHDEGTTKTPFGAKSDLAKPAQATQLAGALGQGESLQSLVQTAGGGGEAARRYRALYDAMAPAAEQTVEQENIPAGSRYLIKRYFESIRPRE